MSRDKTTRAIAERRAAVEEELRQRLARDRAAADPGAAVALQCLECRGISGGDARFCTHCGARFNVAVVAVPSPAAANGSEPA